MYDTTVDDPALPPQPIQWLLLGGFVWSVIGFTAFVLWMAIQNPAATWSFIVVLMKATVMVAAIGGTGYVIEEKL